MTRRLILSPLAQADIDDVYEWSFEKWGEEQAEDYVLALRKMLSRLADKPYLGRQSGQIRHGYYRMSVGTHVIFYQVIADSIDVKRVLHQAMDFKRHL